MHDDGSIPFDALSDFYEADEASLSAEEREQLTPILNSLKDFGKRYDNFVPIGKGAEKEIYRVYDRRLGRRVALAYPVKAETQVEVESFLREARLTANLAHPNILPIHNMGIDPDGKPFFTMELLPGDSLKDIVAGLKKGEAEYVAQYTLETRLSIFGKICDAMAYAHSRGVLHLDLKPSNIRVGPFGDVFICDWGLARVIQVNETGDLEPGELDGDELNDFTLSGTVKGTPGFMAPEQADGKSAKTERTDIYALGAILYTLLVWDIPVEGVSANEVVENTLAGNIVPPRRRKPNIPIGLDPVAVKALSLKQDERYANVQALQREITLYSTGYPTEAEQAGAVRRVVLLTQRHAKIALLSVFSLVVLLAVGTAAFARIDRERTDAMEAKGVAEALNKDLADMLDYLANQPDMRHPALNIELLEKKITPDLDPAIRKELLGQKGILHFILEEFNEAVACFEESGVGYSPRLLPPARRFAAIKPDDQALLKESELAEMFAGDPPLFKQFTYYTYLHHIRRKPNLDLDGYGVLAGTMLEEMNVPRPREVVALDIRKGKTGYILDLSGKPYSRYKLLIPGVLYSNVLEPYTFERLDISHTPLTDLVEVEDLKVRTLRMVGLDWMPNTRFLMPRLKRMGVKTLIVDKDRFPEKFKDRLRETLELIEE